MARVYKDIEIAVDVELSDFPDDEIRAEYEKRADDGAFVPDHKDTISELYYHYINGNQSKIDSYFKELFWDKLGRIV